jgi:hypothetical protein
MIPQFRIIGKPLGIEVDPSTPPGTLLEIWLKARRHPGHLAFSGRVAGWARHSRSAAGAALLALPRSAGMLLTYPAAVFALKTGHGNSRLANSSDSETRIPTFSSYLVWAPRRLFTAGELRARSFVLRPGELRKRPPIARASTNSYRPRDLTCCHQYGIGVSPIIKF